jgi:hypothetical protein
MPRGELKSSEKQQMLSVSELVKDWPTAGLLLKISAVTNNENTMYAIFLTAQKYLILSSF